MEVSNVQCGFVEEKGTRNAMFILRNIVERGIEMQKDIYTCFIDYSKAFDKVKHKDMIEILQQLNFDSRDSLSGS